MFPLVNFTKETWIALIQSVKPRNLYKVLSNKECLKNKIKQGIGIAEKSQETRRDHCGGNVNHKSLF